MLLRQRDFPREFYVGDGLWTLRFVRRLDDDPGRITWGLTDPSDKVIYIRMGQTAKGRLETFVHELLHAVEYEYEIEIPHALIYKLEGPLVRLILDNLVSTGRVTWQ